MIGVADGAGVTGLTIDGVVEEEAAGDRFFLRSASGFLMQFFSSFHPQQEKTSKFSLHKQWLPYMHIIMNMSY